MATRIKNLIFLLAKYAGIFHLTRYLYSNRIRVLCYHGFTLNNESDFRPQLFIDPDIFEQRMQTLQQQGYNVVSLDHALQCLERGHVPRDTVVITIDDGFFSVYSAALPILEKYKFPATLYLTSYYFDRACPIYPLAVNYLFWSSKVLECDFGSLGIPTVSAGRQSTRNNDLISEIVDYGQSREDDAQRVEILRSLGELLAVNYDDLNDSRILGLINRKELATLGDSTVDIQMHTHRHDFPLELDAADEELRKNRDVIDPLLSSPMQHFCYPSGLWSDKQWSVLEKNGINSATTCLPGLMSNALEHYAIPRFLDSASISPIVFESELAGFSELCRNLKFGRKHKATQ